MANDHYEIGVKLEVVMTSQSNLVVVGLAFPGNPYNGDTLAIQLSQVKRVTGKMPEEESVDLSFHGRRVIDSQVFISGQNRGVNERLSCAGHNMRSILMKIKIFCADFWKRLASCNGPEKLYRYSFSRDAVHMHENFPKQGFSRLSNLIHT